jgi:hypothetical protein
VPWVEGAGFWVKRYQIDKLVDFLLQALPTRYYNIYLENFGTFKSTLGLVSGIFSLINVEF